jgi:hypothetical protein
MIGAGERDDGRELVKCAGGCCAPGVGLYPHELDESGLCSQCREEAAGAFDALRILTGPICSSCWNTDGEIVVATEETVPLFGASEDLCESCANREPGDQGEDDGPITMAQQADIDARDGWMTR